MNPNNMDLHEEHTNQKRDELANLENPRIAVGDDNGYAAGETSRRNEMNGEHLKRIGTLLQ